MKIWAISDLHLSFGVLNKQMDIFGPQWIGYTEKIKKHWQEQVAAEDLVLIGGDISWALATTDALVDLNWIAALPGKKVLIKGNHDYWWSSYNKIQAIMPPNMYIIQNNAIRIEEVAIAGTRLWDTDEYNFDPLIDFGPDPKIKQVDKKETQKIFTRELQRLEMSLQQMDQNADIKIAMTHYPPIGTDLQDSLASKILEKYGVNHCIFGHLHNVKKQTHPLFGKKNSVHYYLTSCDFLDFNLLQIV